MNSKIGSSLSALLLLLIIFSNCEQKKKQETTITSTGKENINQVDDLDEDDDIIVMIEGSDEDIKTFINPKKANQQHKTQDSIDRLKQEQLKNQKKVAQNQQNIRNQKPQKRHSTKSTKRKNKHSAKQNNNTLTISYGTGKPTNEISNKNQPTNTPPPEQPLKEGVYKISVQKTQKITYNTPTRIVFTTTEPIKYENFIIPAQTIITGYTGLENDRMLVNFNSIRINGKIKDISKMKIYDLDGNQGIKINLTGLKNKKRGTNTGNKILQTVTSKLIDDNIGRTITNDAQNYGSQDITGSFTLESSKKCLVKTKYY